MKMWMKALVWLGLGGGIGFFAGYQVGYKRNAKDSQEEADERIQAYAERLRDQWDQRVAQAREDEIRQSKAEIAELRRQYEEALDAQREYLGGKDDEVISEGQIEMDLEEDPEEDVDVMDEVPEMPEDILPDSGDYDGDDAIEADPFHPEDLRPFAISASEYLQNAHGYDTVELDYYTEDCVIFDPLREEKWTHPEQLLGLGWKAMFISSGKPVTEAYVQNDTMEILYKITRIEDSFERLYEEE